MAQFVAIYGSLMLLASITAGIVAAVKRRDTSFWAAWSFLFPPMLIMLLLMSKNTGPRPRRPALDAGERDDHIL